MAADPDGAPFRLVGAVVAALALTVGVVLLGVRLGWTDALGVLTTPLVVLLPAGAAGLYWYLRRE